MKLVKSTRVRIRSASCTYSAHYRVRQWLPRFRQNQATDAQDPGEQWITCTEFLFAEVAFVAGMERLPVQGATLDPNQSFLPRPRIRFLGDRTASDIGRPLRDEDVPSGTLSLRHSLTDSTWTCHTDTWIALGMGDGVAQRFGSEKAAPRAHRRFLLAAGPVAPSNVRFQLGTYGVKLNLRGVQTHLALSRSPVSQGTSGQSLVRLWMGRDRQQGESFSLDRLSIRANSLHRPSN